MHELSITQNILNIALRHAGEAEAKSITNIYLVVGQLSSVVDDSVQFYWSMVTKGTIAENAQLHFRRIQTELLCKSCGKRYTPYNQELACPDCTSQAIEVVAGDEFYLEAIDIDNQTPGETNA